MGALVEGKVQLGLACFEVDAVALLIKCVALRSADVERLPSRFTELTGWLEGSGRGWEEVPSLWSLEVVNLHLGLEDSNSTLLGALDHFEVADNRGNVNYLRVVVVPPQQQLEHVLCFLERKYKIPIRM